MNISFWWRAISHRILQVLTKWVMNYPFNNPNSSNSTVEHRKLISRSIFVNPLKLKCDTKTILNNSCPMCVLTRTNTESQWKNLFIGFILGIKYLSSVFWAEYIMTSDGNCGYICITPPQKPSDRWLWFRTEVAPKVEILWRRRTLCLQRLLLMEIPLILTFECNFCCTELIAK